MAENGQPQGDQSIAQAITEISERVTLLVREEIELARAEITEKVTRIAKGAAVAVAAGIFVSTALLFALHGLAWLSFDLLFNNVYWGFFFVAGLLFVLGGIAGFLASKWLRSGPPTPDMAIDEAQRIRETLTGEPSKPDVVEAGEQ
ncbi:MAG TPA: phage holin family protein [Solirubrobacteraceae bacterium]